MRPECEACDVQGPMLPGIVSDVIELHRAWHGACWAVAELFASPVIHKVARLLDGKSLST